MTHPLETRQRRLFHSEPNFIEKRSVLEACSRVTQTDQVTFQLQWFKTNVGIKITSSLWVHAVSRTRFNQHNARLQRNHCHSFNARAQCRCKSLLKAELRSKFENQPFFSSQRDVPASGSRVVTREGDNATGAESPNKVASTLFNAAHLLPKQLRFKHGGGAPNLFLTPLRPWSKCGSTALDSYLIYIRGHDGKYAINCGWRRMQGRATIQVLRMSEERSGDNGCVSQRFAKQFLSRSNRNARRYHFLKRSSMTS